jgi:parallel beta-helix repeat protein
MILLIGMLGLAFELQMVEAVIERVYIRPDGSIDPPIAAIFTTDSITYTLTSDLYVQVVVERDNIIIDGSNHLLQRDGTGRGIDLADRTNVTIKNIEIRDFQSGIWLSQSSNNKVFGSKILNNTFGIWIYGSTNTVQGNMISNNSNSGIVIDVDSSDNTIHRNNITRNNQGVWFILASGNNLHHNNFVDNTQQVYLSTSGYGNVWDNGYPSGGNYWSNYIGDDSDHDGIGETLYILDADNYDRYPLMGMFSRFDIPLDYNVNVISNSTIEGFECFESNSTIKIYVSNMTATQTFGFCRMCIPKSLMSPPYTVMIDRGLTEILYFNDQVHDNSTHRWIYFAYEHSIREILIQGDITPPTIYTLSPENETYSLDDVPLTFTVDEAPCWMGYGLDGQANVTITGNTTLTNLADGSHCVVVYANDTAGNMGASSTVCFTVDTTPPNITDVSQTPLENNVSPEEEVEINATITDDVSGVNQVTLNYTNGNGTWITIGMTNLQGDIWTATIPAFPYCTNVTYIVIAEDNVGNIIMTEETDDHYHVIPEFLSSLVFPLFMIATLLAVMVYRRKHSV